MNMLTLGAAGIAAVLLAVWMKGVKAEYGIFVVIAAQLFFQNTFFPFADALKGFL